MAIAKAECICSECGEAFVCRSFRHKRAFADSFEDWGEENVDLCPVCRNRLKMASWINEARYCVKLSKKLHLPPLEGSQSLIMSAEYTRVHIFEAGPNAGEEEFFDFIFETCTSAGWWAAHKSASSMKDLIFLMKYAPKDKPIWARWKRLQTSS